MSSLNWKVISVKPTDFAEHLTAFLTNWLTKQRNASPKTIHSYRDTFKLLLKYCQEREHIPPERITMSTLNVEVIQGFLLWLETEKSAAFQPETSDWQPSIPFSGTYRQKNLQDFIIFKKSLPSR